MRLLVIRTSAMGDVALTTPVLKGMRQQFPDVEMVLLTRSAYRPFFSSVDGLELYSPDLKKRHKGFTGIVRLYIDILKTGKIDHVIDLHDVLRSKVLRILFRLSGVPSSVIDKGRSDKKAVIKGKIKSRLKHSVERYSDTFAAAGFSVVPSAEQWIIPQLEALLKAEALTASAEVLNIGVAPYAKHKLKMWPEVNMEELLRLISAKQKSRFWLFGGTEDLDKLEVFQGKIPNSVIVAGKFSLDEELAIMSKLNFMIAMDSSNMHMAALVGTKVISIWGGTDPISGFWPWMQPESFSIRISTDELTCRPCTTFGKGECRRLDHACMYWLTPDLVFRKISKFDIW